MMRDWRSKFLTITVFGGLAWLPNCKPVDEGNALGPGDLPAPAGCSVHSVDGDLSAATPAELAAFDGVTHVKGGLRLRGSVTSTPELRCLVQVKGDLSVASDSIATLALPELSSVGGTLGVVGSELTHIEMPALTSVGALNSESVRFEGAPKLEVLQMGALETIPAGLVMRALGAGMGAELELDLGSLREVEGIVHLESNAGLTTLQGLSRLEHVGTLTIRDHQRLATVPLVNLGSVKGTLGVTQNAGLTSLDLSYLSSVGAENSESVRVQGSFALEVLNIQSLRLVPASLILMSLGSSGGAPLVIDASSLEAVTGELYFKGNPTLETLAGFAALKSAGSLVVAENAALSECEAKRLAEALGLESPTIAGNLPDPSCS